MSNLYNPDYLSRLCKKYGLAPSKRYGQNYLVDQEVIKTIIGVADLKPTDTVVEVGPGFGVLTLALAEKVKKVFSFEIEKKLQSYWAEKINNEKIDNLEIVWGNVLREFERFCHSDPPTGGEESLSQSPNGQRSFASLKMTDRRYKVVANLPYQITSPIVRLFLENPLPPTEMVLMVQKEVAERICARPGDMSLLSVAVQYYAQAELAAPVPRSAFWPEPRVDSAVIRLTQPENKRARNQEFDGRFFSLVKAGFANRRKFLLKNLLPLVGKENKGRLERAFLALNLKSSARAQELSVAQWVELTEELLDN
ncbi:MAG: Ribosomal RNA small subunit methyltransferase A [Candidatus Kaiserbacteria bacterium GW2011_GWA2_49_19]|uniref:Ribosomal RNA small subunit methyltransferase A n=1 Tax=Candidatus Kaiserbacteria bacterium GW2011_GWA2_49_19 TaxID=1618669 RepID=A0A0G1VS79_9BACT|nr:MAG: Ribosomal RNA small subunit methyltransferase A [Candidatus Kaiserbacteria bacterium GW2011_GWA2_49_19]